MSETLSRPRRRARSGGPGQQRLRRTAGATATARPADPGNDDHNDGQAARSAPLVGSMVALSTVVAGLSILVVVALAAWVATPHRDAGSASAMAMAVQVWLLAHHTSLSLVGGHFALVPLGLTLLLALVLVRAGRKTARLCGVAEPGRAVAVTIALALPYGLMAAVLTGPVALTGSRPDTVQALTGAFALAAVAGGLGVVCGAGLDTRVRAALPTPLRTAVKAGIVAAVVMLAAGGALVAAALVQHIARVTALHDSLHAGVVGGVLLTLLSVVAAPNAAVWGAAYCAGPGFAVGTGTSVTPFDVHLGPVPAFPLLGALPGDGPAPAVALLAFGGPLLAGVVAGWLVCRRQPERTIRDAVSIALGSGCCAGVVLALAAWLAGGPAGPGRLAVVGPSPWQVGLAVAAEVGGVAALVATALTYRRR